MTERWDKDMSAKEYKNGMAKGRREASAEHAAQNPAERPDEKAEFSEIRGKLRDAFPPIGELDDRAELRRDLWPEMLRRLEQSRGLSWREVALREVPWFDWALLAVSGAAVLFFPALIPALLYHL